MTKFRKKPVVIEASRWYKNGDHPNDYDNEWHGFTARALGWEGEVVRYFRQPDIPGTHHCQHCGRTMHEHGWIDTLEGGHIVCPGDWIITGVKGERYSCKPDIFEATYDLIEEPPKGGGNR